MNESSLFHMIFEMGEEKISNFFFSHLKKSCENHIGLAVVHDDPADRARARISHQIGHWHLLTASD